MTWHLWNYVVMVHGYLRAESCMCEEYAGRWFCNLHGYVRS